MSNQRPGDHMSLGFPPQSVSLQTRTGSPTSTSPNDPTSAGAIRSPFGLSSGLGQSSKMAGASRSGNGSPSHDMASSGRLFSKRAREIQAQEGISGLPVNPWGGPPTSGNSTPLRENIPESPTDGFPDFTQLPTPDSLPQTRRARAGTVPSRFPAGAGVNGMLNIPALASKTSRPSPSHTPFKSPSPGIEQAEGSASTLLSRLRAGSMPQRSPFAQVPGTSSPFGVSIFSSWTPTGRERGNTLASIASVPSNNPSSPTQSHFSREGAGENDVHMRTLDYLGLAETPQPPRAQLATPYMPTYVDFTKAANRFRSYSVNNKDKYADEEDDYDEDPLTIMENQYAQLQDQLAATNAAIQQHNLAVQAFQAARPRARTAGVLDTPASRILRNYIPTPSRLDASITAADIQLPEERQYEDLPQAVAAMTLGRSNSRNNNGLLSAEEPNMEGPTSALWLGSIPTSTTTSTLTEMFKSYGPILSARVLTHKNCGFVNFERVDSAINAKANMNGKEIFPGAGPIRINFAKPPSASNTPGHDGAFPSPSPDPFAKGQENGQNGSTGASGDASPTPLAGNAIPTVAPLSEMTVDILNIVQQFGATEEDKYKISANLQNAIQFDNFIDEIPPIKEPAHTRVHDAPKLRDIRKRIDNQTLSQQEIENIAIEMLPEIAELASDYLGNTVVQKLFEHCSDSVRDQMLAEIAPHMAEIGVHKNGTWAAQKIIDVCKTPQQLNLIVENLRPYTIPLFLDQYGNYVLQGCLKFGPPYNDFIFETMLSKMWEVSQGRYGARAMRACLESHHATKDQQRMLAAAIALHSVQLATNANGALLLTWFLDTCTFPQRRTVLSPQLVPYLLHLCTHKVAYLTVLKVINQKAEADARDTILKALFFTQNDQVLEAILSDHACGATLIFKVLTTPFFDETIRTQVVENVKNVLIRIKAQPGQGYKRLMDEVGLSTRSGGSNSNNGNNTREHTNNNSNNTNNSERQRPTSRQTPQHQQQNQQQQQQPQPAQQAQQQQPGQFTPGPGQYYNPLNVGAPNYNDMAFGIPRSEGLEIPQQFPAFVPQGQMYGGAATPMAPATALQQMQYQQSMMARGAPPMNNYYPAGMPAGFGGFQTPSPSIDQYRGTQAAMSNGSPIQPPPGAPQMPNMPPGGPQGPYGAAPGFGMNMGMPTPGYGYGAGPAPMGGAGMPPQQQNVGYMQEQGNNNNTSRRGRVSQEFYLCSRMMVH
ncbi:hypothetical protein B0H65DRAFT_577840 [Neurospora tetraspora]|uniref:RNA binding protein Jsn1 n=1 Tax=Neurospora tetraspora TaxID=94610 RepID=A0AAE0JA57_9PEZI|nr:hypothetical protein B0H65DRAFT_577840 [Neurospora tetraspora]